MYSLLSPLGKNSNPLPNPSPSYSSFGSLKSVEGQSSIAYTAKIDHRLRMNAIIPLLGTAAAAAAIAFLAYNNLRRANILEEQYKQIKDHVLEEQYKQLRDAAAKFLTSSKQPITVLVLGFQNHGRSSFINTMFRVLYKEEGLLAMHADIRDTRTKYRMLGVRNTLLRKPKYLMNIIDTPCLSTSDDIDENAIRNVLRGQYDAAIEGADISESKDPAKQRKVQTVPECVILVMKAGGSYMGGPAFDRLPALARIIRQEGLKFMVVLTHKKEAQKASVDLQILARIVAMEAGADFVHCIENYVVDRSGGKNASNVVLNDFDTHIQILSVVRECFEYVEQRRQVKPENISEGEGALDAQASYDSASN